MNIINKIDLKIPSAIALVFILLSCNASNSIDVKSEASLPKSNNTPDLVDRNILYGQLYLQPTKTAEFIVLDFTIQPTGAAFPE